MSSTDPGAPRESGALAAAAGHALIASASYLMARQALGELPHLGVAWMRVVLSGLFYGGLLLATGRALLPPRGERLPLFLLGLLGGPINQTLFLVGLPLTTVAHAAILYAMTPTFVLLIARLAYGEPVTAPRALGAGLAFLGAALVLTESGDAGRPRLGDPIILTGVLTWALYTLRARRLTLRHGALASTAWSFWLSGMAVVPLLPLCLPDRGVLATASPGALGGVLWLAGMSSFLAYLLWSVALRGLVPSRVAIFTNLQPVLASAMAWAALGEPVTGRELVGGVLVLAGVLVVQRS